MNQETFSHQVYLYLLANHPLFVENLKYKADNSFECSLLSPTRKFSVWIATFDSEITIGMEDLDQISEAHTHMSFYGNEISEQIEALSQYLYDIFHDKLVFIHSSLTGYTWTSNLIETLMEKDDNESIKFFTWTGEV